MVAVPEFVQKQPEDIKGGAESAQKLQGDVQKGAPVSFNDLETLVAGPSQESINALLGDPFSDKSTDTSNVATSADATSSYESVSKSTAVSEPVRQEMARMGSESANLANMTADEVRESIKLQENFLSYVTSQLGDVSKVQLAAETRPA